jgi:hypothetical protein
MASYRSLIQQISGYFDGCEFLHVPRADNDQADALAWIGSTRQAIPAGVSLQCLRKPSIKPSPKSESIFVSAAPEAVESDSGAAAAGPGTSAGGTETAAVVPGPGAAAAGPGTLAGGTGTAAVAPGPGAAAAVPGTSPSGSGTAAVAPGPGTPQPGPVAAAVGPGTSTTQQDVVDSTPPPPNPTALVSVAIMTVDEVEAPSWA